MNINSIVNPTWIPATHSVRPLHQPAVPQAPPVEAMEQALAPTLEPQAALRSWLSQYSNHRDNNLYDRVAADTSPEGTLFRRGLMISGVVNLVGA